MRCPTYPLSRQRLPRRPDDAVLRRLVEIAVHREADPLLGEPFADRRPALGDRETLVGLLTVQRNRVVDRRRDALALQRRCKSVAGAWRQADGVLRPNRRRAGRKLWN